METINAGIWVRDNWSEENEENTDEEKIQLIQKNSYFIEEHTRLLRQS